MSSSRQLVRVVEELEKKVQAFHQEKKVKKIHVDFFDDVRAFV